MSMIKVHIGLFIFHWLILGNIIIPYILSSISIDVPRLLILREMIATLIWIGFVLAISGMEAWVKFKAPVCPRALKLDIGRTIFPALNAVECSYCLLCWQQHMSRSRLLTAISSSYISISSNEIPHSLILVTVILALDVIWLTPKLVYRGKQVVYLYLKSQGGSEIEEILLSTEFKKIEKEMMHQTTPLKKDKSHIIYVVLEFIKLLGLGHLVVSLATSLLSHRDIEVN